MVEHSHVKTQAKKFENKHRFQKLFCAVTLHERTDFHKQKFFWLRSFFDHFFKNHRSKKWPEQKNLLKAKINFYMPVNHAKEFLKSAHNKALFSQLFARALIQLCSVNFEAKSLKMVLFNSEFLNVSMVKPAPESPARCLLYCRFRCTWL